MKRSCFLGLLAFGFLGSQAAGQSCFDTRTLWLACPGNATPTIEDFEGFTADTSFEVAGGIPLGGGMNIEAVNGLAFRNTVDVPPFLFGDNNGTNHASCFTNQDLPETQVHVTFAATGSFGCDVTGATSGEVAQMQVYSAGTLVDCCSIASNNTDQFIGYVAAAGMTIDQIVFRSDTLTPGGGGEGFTADNFSLGGGAGCMGNGTMNCSAPPPPPPPPPPGCSNDRTTFMAACGAPSDFDDFSGLLVDTPFDAGPVNIGTSMTIEAFNAIGFRNILDVPPFQFGDNNGTNNASCFTNQDEPVEILITFGGSAGGFGAEAFDALGLEMMEMAVMNGGMIVGVCPVSTQGAAWVGYIGMTDSVLLRSATLVPGGGGEGFGLDDLTVCTGGPGPIGMPPAGSMCNPNNPNSTGIASTISAFGSTSVAAMDVRLSCDNVPPGQFGIFFTSQTLGFVANPGGSNGNICVLGNQGRYNMASQIFVGAGPGTPVPVGGLQVGNIPVPVNPTIPAFTPGTWYFQAWHRDIGMTNNFSDVVQINFIP